MRQFDRSGRAAGEKKLSPKPARPAFHEREITRRRTPSPPRKECPSSMQNLWHQFREGGWVMYPVFALGLVVVGAAARFALRGEHQLLPFIRWVIVSLLLTGAFGFTLGMMKTLHAAQGPGEPMLAARIVMEGTTESANNLAAMLIFGAIACVGVAVGQRRFPQPNPSAVAR
jgi:hypothetical protein